MSRIVGNSIESQKYGPETSGDSRNSKEFQECVRSEMPRDLESLGDPMRHQKNKGPENPRGPSMYKATSTWELEDTNEARSTCKARDS